MPQGCSGGSDDVNTRHVIGDDLARRQCCAGGGERQLNVADGVVDAAVGLDAERIQLGGAGPGGEDHAVRLGRRVFKGGGRQDSQGGRGTVDVFADGAAGGYCQVIDQCSQGYVGVGSIADVDHRQISLDRRVDLQVADGYDGIVASYRGGRAYHGIGPVYHTQGAVAGVVRVDPNLFDVLAVEKGAALDRDRVDNFCICERF